MARIIHTKVVFDIETLETIEDEFYIYAGDCAECGGGGGGGDTTTVDYGYNSRMATISEKQQSMADDYWNNVYKPYYQPLEVAQAKANAELMPYETNLYRNTLGGLNSLLGYQVTTPSTQTPTKPSYVVTKTITDDDGEITTETRTYDSLPEGYNSDQGKQKDGSTISYNVTRGIGVDMLPAGATSVGGTSGGKGGGTASGTYGGVATGGGIYGLANGLIDASSKQTDLYGAQVDAAKALLPSQKKAAQSYYDLAGTQTGLLKDQMQAAQSAIKGQQQAAGLENSLYQQQLKSAAALEPASTNIAQQFLNQSLKGVSVKERMGLAQADVANAWAGTQAANNRAMARMGVNPNSSRFAGIQSQNQAQKAAQMAGARTQARVGAEQENYERLGKAAGYNVNSNLNQNLQSINGLSQLGNSASSGVLSGMSGLGGAIAEQGNNSGVMSGASNLTSQIMQGLSLLRG